MKPAAVLLVKGGEDEGKTFGLAKDITTIGRTSLNDLVVDHPAVSRKHAGIRRDRDGYWISDLGSKNGTFVNGENVGDEPRRLRNRDRIEVGTESPVHWVFVESQASMDLPRLDKTDAE